MLRNCIVQLAMLRAFGEQPLREGAVRFEIGAPEAVDRLLRIADDDGACRR